MIKIHKNFTGGNISVKSIDGNVITLENELRDTTIDWFYFAFCVEGAEGKTLTFKLQSNRLGYFGPAVSHDLKDWHWLGDCDDTSFTYSFGESEDKVYFAHSLLYHPERFGKLCQRLGMESEELCKSRKGRSVPCLRLGEGEVSIIFTSRHHACESTGSYVLEGVLEELALSPIPNSRVLVVPFADYDGVVDGDQGKSRSPHDHNRDYIDAPIYPEVQAICKYANEHGCHYGVDFHSPWHKGGINDKIFIVRNMEEKLKSFDAFSKILEEEITDKSMQYLTKNDFPPNTAWNMPSTNFGLTMNLRPECKLAFSLESAYFGREGNITSESRLIELGRCFARAVKRFASDQTLKNVDFVE